MESECSQIFGETNRWARLNLYACDAKKFFHAEVAKCSRKMLRELIMFTPLICKRMRSALIRPSAEIIINTGRQRIKLSGIYIVESDALRGFSLRNQTRKYGAKVKIYRFLRRDSPDFNTREKLGSLIRVFDALSIGDSSE